MKNLFLFFTIFISVFLFSPFTFSKDIYQLDDIIVSSYLIETSKKETMQSTSVFSKEDIEKKQIITAGDLLRHINGVNIVSLGSPGEDLDIRIRGSDRDEILVLLDGTPINSLIDSRASILSSIPVDIIDRVEIIKGAESVIYGTSAVGGVIHIITKKNASEKTSTIESLVGNLGTFKETATTVGQINKFNYALSFSRHDQYGRFANDRFSGNNLFANFGWQPNDQFKLQFNNVFIKNRQELPFAFATSFANFPTVDLYVVRDFDRYLNRTLYIPSLSAEYQPTEWYKLKTQYSYYYESLNLKNSLQGETAPAAGATLDSQDFTSSSHRHFIDLQNHFTILEENNFKIQFVAGFSSLLEYLKYTDAPFAGDTTTKVTTNFPDYSQGQDGNRYNLSWYGQTNLLFSENFQLGLGFRFDKNSTYGKAYSPRFSASYFERFSKTKFFANYSKGFLAPTLDQYYSALLGTTLSQRLDKETSHSMEIGFTQNYLENFSLELSYFYISYNGHIDDLQLINKSHSKGIDSIVEFTPFEWSKLILQYTYNDAVNDDTGDMLPHRYKHRFYSDLQITPIWDVDFNLNYTFVSKRKVLDVISTQALGDLPLQYYNQFGTAAGDFIPAYHLLSFGVSKSFPFKKLIKSLTVHAKASNILNKSYEEKYGFPMPKLRIIGGLKAKF